MRKELIAYNDPKSPVSEVYRTLRTNIQFMNTNRKLQSLLVTSTLPGEGKSWVSSNLAVTFAQAGKKVVLVDADMRKGRQYTIFSVSPKPGLSNYLSGIDENNNENTKKNILEYIQKTEIENLYLMAAGNIPPNPSELLISPKMVKLVEELKDIADIVIIDGTPVELVTDSIIIARLVESTVIVTAYEETKKEALKRVISSIQNVGGKIAGVVINKIPVSVRKYKDSYYYGANATKDTKKRNRKGSSPKQPSSRYSGASSRQRKNVEDMKKRVKPDIDIEKNNIKARGTTPISHEKTSDILKQINDYLDNEKRDLG